jgi:hypothetical protein
MRSGIETIDNRATDLVINRRRERLKRQFQYELKHKVELTNVKHSRHSLDRLFWFVYIYTDICTIESIKTDTLFEYLKYHHLEEFKLISFSQAVKDVNYFLFVRNKNISTSTLKVDLSLQNYNLWLRV